MKKILFVLISIGIIVGGFYLFFKKTSELAKKEEQPEEEKIPEYAYLINDKGIFSKYYDKAFAKLKELTIDEKIGQLFLVRVPESDAVNVLINYQFGGYIIFDRDVRNISKEGFIEKINSYQSVSKVPLIIASDEEGGTVTRVSRYPALVSGRFRSPQEIYNDGGLDAIREDTINKSAILKELGINVNLAPVADVSNNPNDFIYNRTIGLEAEGTGRYVETVIKASKGTDVSYVLKHFPGYGNNVDTHTGIAYDQRSIESFEAVDLVPFKVGIKAGAEAVLVNHNIIVNMENNIPASLSSVVHQLLRNDIGFTGVIMTDDIAMDAIDKYVDKPSVKALLAGNDMIIISDYERGIREIKEALETGEITEEMIDRAVMRTLAWKYYKGLM